MKKPKRKLYKVIMTFDMSWGVRSIRTTLTKRTLYPRGFISGVRHSGYLSRGRFIPATRLIEARIVEVVS